MCYLQQIYNLYDISRIFFTLYIIILFSECEQCINFVKIKIILILHNLSSFHYARLFSWIQINQTI